MHPHTKQMIEIIENRHPDFWRFCYPRIYREAGNYGSPKLPAALHATSLAWVMDEEGRAASSARMIYLAQCVAKQHAQPCLYIAPELFGAIAHTDPPPDIRWVDLPLPFESAVLMLPRGALFHPTDGEVYFLGYARIRASEFIRFSPAFRWSEVKDDVFCVYTALADQANFPFLDTTLNALTMPRIGDRQNWAGGKPAVYTVRAGPHEMDIAESESDFLNQCVQLVFSLLMAMTARPALLSEGRKVGHHKKSRREIWEPNIVGRDYRIVREAHNTEQGTHASPRTHWRRGHWRLQRHGPGMALQKSIFIDPVLVG